MLRIRGPALVPTGKMEEDVDMIPDRGWDGDEDGHSPVPITGVNGLLLTSHTTYILRMRGMGCIFNVHTGDTGMKYG